MCCTLIVTALQQTQLYGHDTHVDDTADNTISNPKTHSRLQYHLHHYGLHFPT